MHNPESLATSAVIFLGLSALDVAFTTAFAIGIASLIVYSELFDAYRH
jgi:hypothetical protein